jgi:hypothetical protein
MRKNWRLLSLALGVLPTAFTATIAQAVSLSLIPSLQSVAVGDTITIKVQVSGIKSLQAPALSAFDLGVDFDPLLLAFKSPVRFGDPSRGDLLDLSNQAIRDESATDGLVSFAEVSFDDPATLEAVQPDTFILASLSFSSLKAGSSSLGLVVTDTSLGDALGDPILLMGQPGNALVAVSQGSTQVPEPTVSLLGLGLTIGLGAALNQKKSS